MIPIDPDKPEDIGYIHETNSQVFETDAEARLKHGFESRRGYHFLNV